MNRGSPIPRQVSSNCSRSRGRWIRRSGQRTEPLDDAVSCDPHGHNRPAFHEFNEWRVKRLALVLSVVTREKLSVSLEDADVDKSIALRFDSAENYSGQIARNSIWFHEHESLFY